MKRTLKSLLAIAGLAFLALGALPAQAVTCAPIKTSQPATNWPYNTNTVACTGTTVSGQNALFNSLLGLQAQTPNLWTKFQQFKPKVYLFKNATDYETYMTANGINHPAAPAGPGPGFTHPAGGLLPVFTVVLEDKFGSGPVDQLTKNAVVHEMGHWADYIYAPLLGASLVSNSVLMSDLVARDWVSYNIFVPCFKNGSSGLFTGYGIPPGAPIGLDQFFCSGLDGSGPNLNPDYAGLTNKQIIATAWGGLASQIKENWSELLAVQTGNKDSGPGLFQTLDQNYSPPNSFVCSKTLLQKLTVSGTLPTAADYAASSCYVAPKVNAIGAPALPSGIVCDTTKIVTSAGFLYPNKPGYGQYVYCGANKAGFTHKETARQQFYNLPFDVYGTSMMKNWFQSKNITLYVFRDYIDAQALLGTAVPADMANPFRYGFTQEAVTGNATTKFVVVFERVKIDANNWTDVPTANGQFRGVTLHYTARMIDALRGRPSGKVQSAYNTDLNNFNAKPVCQVFPFMCSNNVLTATYTSAPYTPNMSNLDRLLVYRPEYTKYFKDSEVPTEYRGLWAEMLALKLTMNQGENLNGADAYVSQFGKCVGIYAKAKYDTGELPTTAELNANSCP